ncbi:MAG: transposase [Desulfamplus sp.]|nr:transposase [Desulfamplus sp.]
MIKKNFEDSFTQEWIDNNITDPTNELVILRQIIPWDKLTEELSQFYNDTKGRIGKSIRVVIAVLLLSKLRLLSDENVIKSIKENRYYQYFCNVSDDELSHFLHPSTLCRIRKRLGEKGFEIMEDIVFKKLHWANVVDPEYALIDSSVLESNIVYPTDVKLVFNAFNKMANFAGKHNISLWWDHDAIKAMWREFCLNKEKNAGDYLIDFAMTFRDALATFKLYLILLGSPEHTPMDVEQLLEILTLLDQQNELKMNGEKHIPSRIVSLDEIDARPIKKGKNFPECEFGSTFQATFNRQGFIITIENFIGKPNDKKLYPNAVELFNKRMGEYPKIAVTDLGYRSQSNLTDSQKNINTVFMGRSDDVQTAVQKACQKARAATEGFIAVIKNWRGMKRSLYKGFSGDRIWSILCQAAHNLKKFIQLFQKEALSEESLMKLGLLG